MPAVGCHHYGNIMQAYSFPVLVVQYIDYVETELVIPREITPKDGNDSEKPLT